MANHAAGFQFLITSVKKQNSLYYSVFFNRWKMCPCSSTLDSVLLKSETEITMDTPGLNEMVKQEINKTK